MTQPLKDGVNGIDFAAGRQSRPCDHHDRKTEVAGGLQLGAGAVAAGVLGNHQFDAMIQHQSRIIRDSERAPRNDDRMARQGRRRDGRVDEAEHIVMLRLGREALEVLAANREQDATRRHRQRVDGTGDIPGAAPIVPRLRLPGRPRQGDERHTGCRACDDRMTAHLGSKRMRRVDDVGYAIVAQVCFEPGCSAKATDPMGDRLRLRALNATGIGKRRVDAALGYGAREMACLSGAAKDQEVVVHGR